MIYDSRWVDVGKMISDVHLQICFETVVFLKIIYFNWRVTALQYCSCFCHTWMGCISHRCTCVPDPEPPAHLPPHPIPQGHPSAPALNTLSIKPGLVIYFTYDNMHVSMLFSQTIPPLPSPTESKRPFFTSCLFRCLAYRVIITIFLDSIYMR